MLSQTGQTTVEYVLMLALVAVALAASLDAFFGALKQGFTVLSWKLALPYP